MLIELSRNKNIKVISTGGVLRDSALSLGGNDAENLLKKFNVDKTILSCKGIHMEKGITESNEGEAVIEKDYERVCQRNNMGY